MNHDIEQLIKIISRLPGIGTRSARRLALYMLKNRSGILNDLIAILQHNAANIIECEVCHNLDNTPICFICRDESRNQKLICVIEDISDLWAIERSGTFNGLYHILGGNLSALTGVGPEELNINSLLKRTDSGQVSELILAINSTIEGKMTIHYLASCFKDRPHIKLTQLACGVPLGGELEYLDEGTLSTALTTRHLID